MSSTDVTVIVGLGVAAAVIFSIMGVIYLFALWFERRKKRRKG